MTDNITVVRETHALDEAWEMGYERFSGIDPELAADVDPSRITDSAAWANHIAPTLRCLAGHRDSGYGTWTEDGQIALIPVGNEDDRPTDGVVTTASEFHRSVVDTWYNGAYKALDTAAETSEADR